MQVQCHVSMNWMRHGVVCPLNVPAVENTTDGAKFRKKKSMIPLLHETMDHDCLYDPRVCHSSPINPVNLGTVWDGTIIG